MRPGRARGCQFPRVGRPAPSAFIA